MSTEEERLVSKAEASQLTGISFAEMARRIKKGEYPVPFADGPFKNSRRFYFLSELRTYIAAKKAERDARSK